ncbi:MAG: aminocarboxymuconate-semialdehyde decarboxylase [Chloroflexota bacterium]|nr:aminocarboxymuconate-semialdehyde decarboxylase [Chloroflexota bacterium]
MLIATGGTATDTPVAPALFDAHTHLLITAPAHYPPPMHAVDQLLALQRSHGVVRSAVYSPMEVNRAFARGEEPLSICVRYNDFIARVQEQHPDEVVGVGIVYPYAGDASAREAERAVRDLGLRGVMVNPYLRGSWLDQDPAAEPLLAAMEALGAPLIVHPEEEMERLVAETLGRRLRYAEGLVLWRTLATTFAMYGFAAGPLLHRFPRLRVVFAHGGGGFWGAAARVDVLFQQLVPNGDAIVRGQWEGDVADSSPLDWLRQHEVYVDVAWLDGGGLRTAVERLGADRLLFGTDGSAHPGSIAYFREQLGQLDLSPDELRAIRHDNAARLFG